MSLSVLIYSIDNIRSALPGESEPAGRRGTHGLGWGSGSWPTRRPHYVQHGAQDWMHPRSTQDNRRATRSGQTTEIPRRSWGDAVEWPTVLLSVLLVPADLCLAEARGVQGAEPYTEPPQPSLVASGDAPFDVRPELLHRHLADSTCVCNIVRARGRRHRATEDLFSRVGKCRGCETPRLQIVAVTSHGRISATVRNLGGKEGGLRRARSRQKWLVVPPGTTSVRTVGLLQGAQDSTDRCNVQLPWRRQRARKEAPLGGVWW